MSLFRDHDRAGDPRRLAGLQGLRGVAALMVLVGHVLAEAQHYFGVTLRATDLPWTRGVDMFFVISGFIITLSARRFAGRPAAFMLRRFLRVAPLYYLFTMLMVAVLLVAPGAAKDTAMEPGQIVSSYLFLPYERHDGRIAPVLSLGWTLNYEMMFYALTALALALPRPFLFLTAAIGGLALLSLVPFGGTAMTFWSNPLILEFLFGIALARLYLAGAVRRSACLATAAVLAGLGLMVVLHGTDLPRWVAAGVPAAITVGGATLACPPGGIPGQALGDASFALYLSHRFTLRLLTLAVMPVLPAGPAGAAIYSALAVAGSILVAVLVFRHVERPFLSAVARRPAGRRATA